MAQQSTSTITPTTPEPSKLDNAKKFYRRAKRTMVEAESIIGELMTQHWNNLVELRRVFYAIPGGPLKQVVFNRVQQLETPPKTEAKK